MYVLGEYVVLVGVVASFAVVLFILAIVAVTVEQSAAQLGGAARKLFRGARERIVGLQAATVQVITERFHPYIHT